VTTGIKGAVEDFVAEASQSLRTVNDQEKENARHEAGHRIVQ